MSKSAPPPHKPPEDPVTVRMVDLGGYVIILVETKDKKIKLYGEYGVFVYLGRVSDLDVEESVKGEEFDHLNGSFFLKSERKLKKGRVNTQT